MIQRRRDAPNQRALLRTPLVRGGGASHVMGMSSNRTFTRTPPRAGAAASSGPVIDQDGREIAPDRLGRGSFSGTSRRPSGDSGFQGKFDAGGLNFNGFTFNGFNFGTSSANPFGNLTREQRIARLDALAKLLDVAFIVPGTNVRYGIDGIIGLIPIVGDVITTAIQLWLVREARALGAPWHVTMRMLGNVALDGTIGAVPLVGDAFDVMFRANIRNMKLLHRWLDKHR